MTLSVGCRAPSVSDLISRIAENYTSSIDDNAVRRYTDEDLLMSSHGGSANNGQLTNEAKQKARQLVLESLTALLEDDCWWDEFFGKYVTEQKRVRMNYPIPLDDQDDKGIFTMQYSDGVMVQDSMLPGIEQEIIQSVLEGNRLLVHAEGIAFAYSFCPAKNSSNIIYRLFANGEMWQSEAQDDDANDCMPRLFETITNNRRIDGELLHNCIGDDEERDLEAIQVLRDLVRKGLLYYVDTHLFE
jgi:ribosomal protein L16 Arg81 hydroxylase